MCSPCFATPAPQRMAPAHSKGTQNQHQLKRPYLLVTVTRSSVFLALPMNRFASLCYTISFVLQNCHLRKPPHNPGVQYIQCSGTGARWQYSSRWRGPRLVVRPASPARCGVCRLPRHQAAAPPLTGAQTPCPKTAAPRHACGSPREGAWLPPPLAAPAAARWAAQRVALVGGAPG